MKRTIPWKLAAVAASAALAAPLWAAGPGSTNAAAPARIERLERLEKLDKLQRLEKLNRLEKLEKLDKEQRLAVREKLEASREGTNAPKPILASEYAHAPGQPPMMVVRTEAIKFDSFLRANPGIAAELSQHPKLIENPAFMAKNPAFAAWLKANPAAAAELHANPSEFLKVAVGLKAAMGGGTNGGNS